MSVPELEKIEEVEKKVERKEENSVDVRTEERKPRLQEESNHQLKRSRLSKHETVTIAFHQAKIFYRMTMLETLGFFLVLFPLREGSLKVTFTKLSVTIKMKSSMPTTIPFFRNILGGRFGVDIESELATIWVAEHLHLERRLRFEIPLSEAIDTAGIEKEEREGCVVYFLPLKKKAQGKVVFS